MADLYSLAGGNGISSGYGIASGLGNSLTSAGGLATLANPVLGLGMMGAGALTNLISKPFAAMAAKAEGKKRFADAQSAFQNKLNDRPNYFTTAGIEKGFNTARQSLRESNAANNSALMDRYSSIQRRQMANKIKSGLTSGAAQASAVQNNIAFQRTANQLYNQQASQLSNLALRESQAKANMADTIEARKSMAARDALMGQGITNPAALGGLTAKITGGY